MRWSASLIGIIGLALSACTGTSAVMSQNAAAKDPEAVAEGFDPLDSMSPGRNKSEALALPLQTVTLSTNDLEATRRFYVDGMGMTMSAPIAVTPEVKAQQRALWDIPAEIDWVEYQLTRPNAAIKDRGAMDIRVLVLDTETPTVHASWDSRGYGGFSMGFPNRDQLALDPKIRSLGFGARGKKGPEIYNVPRTDGTSYTIHETIFDAPDYVHAVGIDRVGMLPLGAIDEATKLGGPGYSAQVIDDSETVLAFYLDVLGLEIRRDSIFKSAGSDGAMALPDGTEFRFVIMMAKGFGPGGHMLFVDFTNIEGIDNGVAPRVPHRGIGMWSYPVIDLDEVMTRAEQAGTPIVHAPMVLEDPVRGSIRVATLLAPNEFLIEVYEEAS